MKILLPSEHLTPQPKADNSPQPMVLKPGEFDEIDARVRAVVETFPI